MNKGHPFIQTYSEIWNLIFHGCSFMKILKMDEGRNTVEEVTQVNPSSE
jgi:hypothetical protein